MVDGSIIRVHQHGAAKKHQPEEAMGNPVRMLLTAGQCSEIKQADALIDCFTPDDVIADKGYDADSFIATIEACHVIPVIPPKRNRKTAKQYDRHLYKERNLVEKLFQKLKHYRRIATRFERLARTFQAMLCLVAAMIWIN